MIRLVVVGVPAPQGSKTRTKWGMIEAGSQTGRAKLSAWRDAVRAKAREWVEENSASPLAEPVEVAVVFRFAPTKSDPHRTRHQTKPDIDKILRATFDALKLGGLIADDALIFQVTATKLYAVPGETIGATITIWPHGHLEALARARRKAEAATARKAAS